MSRARFADEFMRDAVAQVKERGYSVSEVSDRLGISTKSLYTWISQFSKPVNSSINLGCLSIVNVVSFADMIFE